MWVALVRAVCLFVVLLACILGESWVANNDDVCCRVVCPDGFPHIFSLVTRPVGLYSV